MQPIDEQTWWLKRISKIEAMELAFEIAIVLFLDEHYRIQWSTPQANSLFGYVPGELDGKTLDILLPGMVKERHRKLFNDFMENPVDRTMGTGLDMMSHVFEGVKKGGELIKISILLRVRAVAGKKIAAAQIFPVIEVK